MNHDMHSPFPLLALGLTFISAATAEPFRDYPVTPVPLNHVEITDGFWRQRLDTHFRTTRELALDKCETTGRIDNFRIAAGEKKGEHQGASFNDSDVYKIIEGMADSLNGPMKPEAIGDTFLDIFARGVVPKAEQK